MPAAQIKNINAIRALQREAKIIESKMKVLETRRKTGRLNNSISFVYDARKGAFVFKAVMYGKFQDEGTYRGRQQTETSRRVWPKYTPKTRGRAGTGITPLHFTNPIGKLDIISLVKPMLIKEIKDNIRKDIKNIFKK